MSANSSPAATGTPRISRQQALADSIPVEAVRAYVDDGFVIGERLLDDAEIETLRAETARIANGEVSHPALVDAGGVENVLCVHFPHAVSDVVRDYLAHPAVVGILRRITAAHLPHWDGRVKCMQSMLFVKPPGLPGQAWHQDERFIPTRDRSLLGVWIALDDATIANGCLWVIPRSHRDGYLYPVRTHNRTDEWDASDECFGFDDSVAQPVEVERGSVVFFNGYLLHSSRRNRSDGYRRVLVNHYCNAWSLLPWTEGVGIADFRGVVPVAGEDPYAWRGYQPVDDLVALRPYHRQAPDEVSPG